ncbi:MAG: hypothetical protein RSB69_02305 [Odoribacter sp.]
MKIDKVIDGIEFLSVLLPAFIVIICIIDVITIKTIKVDIFSYLTTTTTIGEAKVTFKNNEIFVSNFPRYSMGVGSMFGVDFGNFSFNKLDKFVYKIATESANSQYIYITIQTTKTDQYGNVSADKSITIGKIEVAESKRYSDFNYWIRELKHQTKEMFWKDKQEYDKQYDQPMAVGQIRIVPAYMPKSIR